jgi:WD40 repeat protein
MISSVDFSIDGKNLAVGSNDGRVSLWKYGRSTETIAEPAPPPSVRFADNLPVRAGKKSA